jgi:hypothetical protein
MQDLDRALADIAAIRTQLARGTEFRGCGPLTIAATGGLAALAGVGQAIWLPDPVSDVAAYLALWIGTAILSLLLVGIEMAARSRRLYSALADEMIFATLEQLTPAGVAGALLTVVLVQFIPQNVWMLPGLWLIVFSLGVFAARRSLPPAMFVVGVWYLAAGLAVLAFAGESFGFAPWAMAVPFSVGQLLMAAVVHRAAGKTHAEA